MKIIIADLRAAGLSEAQILRVVEATDIRETEKRHAQLREASRAYRIRRHQNHDDHHERDDRVYPLPSSSLPLLESKEEERLSLVATGREFAEFWKRYPHKVGKRAAEKSFRSARKRASFETIMAGLERYAAKTDDRPWCNPATWLNQDRWDDQPGPIQEGKPKAAAAQPCRLAYAASWEERSRKQLEEREAMERRR